MAKKKQATLTSKSELKNTEKGEHTSIELAGKMLNHLGFIWKAKIIIVGLVCLVFITAYIHINLNQLVEDFLPVKSVQIEGEFKYLDKERLRQQALPVANGGFFSIDLSVIRSRLENMSWVEDVSVRRQWPDRLIVRVIEKQPVVYWGKDAVISSKGKLFVPENKLSIKLPSLIGPEGQYRFMLTELARMQAWLLETDLYIQKMNLDARRSWTLSMTSGLELRLGRKQMHERLHRFVSVYKSHLKTQKREIKHIDMRYTNGFAVAWKEA
ncbi:Cell division protein FtsQ [hydrothermal vent metagenome]|uniref:Cell division protein FtsQ n=1 Tax=hydrothermal vent metagenome TaxID=652676 RepID=A0A3B0YNA4_9ZZZZ